MHNLKHRSKLGITAVAQSPVQGFSRYAGVAGQLTHAAASTGHSTERLRYHTRIVTLESHRQIGRDGFFVGEKLSRIVQYRFHLHDVTPHPLQAVLPRPSPP